MRTICLLSFVLLLGGPVAAQETPGGTQNAPTSSDKPYTLVSTGFDMLFVSDPGHVFGITFPYTTTAAAGTRVFAGNLQGNYRPQVPIFDCLMLNTVYRRWGFYLGVGINRQLNNDYAANIRSGSDYAFPMRGVTLKLGLDMVYFISRGESLGSIDNYGNTIQALGHTSGPQFTVSEDDGDGNTYDQTFDTYRLEVDYNRSSLDIGPRIALSSKPIGGRVVISLETGWLLPVLQTSRLRLVQVSDDNDHTTNPLASVKLAQNGAVGGVYVGITIGVSIAQLLRS